MHGNYVAVWACEIAVLGILGHAPKFTLVLGRYSALNVFEIILIISTWSHPLPSSTLPIGHNFSRHIALGAHLLLYFFGLPLSILLRLIHNMTHILCHILSLFTLWKKFRLSALKVHI